MKSRRLTALAACYLLVYAVSLLAQTRDAAEDQISGNWGANGRTLLELKFDGKRAVSGTTIWRKGAQASRAAIKMGAFDPETGALKLEGDAKRPDNVESVHYVIEGKLEKDTLAGTFKIGDDTGDFSFKKTQG